MRLLPFLVVAVGGVALWYLYGTDAVEGPRLFVLVAWLGVLLVGAFMAGERLGSMVRDLAIWAVIILALTTAYVFRFEAQDVASRFTGGLIPGSAITAFDDEGRTSVTVVRLPNGHFEVDGRVNGRDARFLIDTGATGIALSYRTAEAVGLPVGQLSFDRRTRTANGVAAVASVRLDRLEIGGIVRENVPASVSSPGALGVNLLGQTFLESLAGYERRADRLTLRD